MVRVIESDLFLFVNILFYFIRSCISMSSYMYLCMCECKSEVKKTQDNVVVVVVK